MKNLTKKYAITEASQKFWDAIETFYGSKESFYFQWYHWHWYSNPEEICENKNILHCINIIQSYLESCDISEDDDVYISVSDRKKSDNSAYVLNVSDSFMSRSFYDNLETFYTNDIDRKNWTCKYQPITWNWKIGDNLPDYINEIQSELLNNGFNQSDLIILNLDSIFIPAKNPIFHIKVSYDKDGYSQTKIIDIYSIDLSNTEDNLNLLYDHYLFTQVLYSYDYLNSSNPYQKIAKNNFDDLYEIAKTKKWWNKFDPYFETVILYDDDSNPVIIKADWIGEDVEIKSFEIIIKNALKISL